MFLADEINRATPRTQSALLEAMEERQVTVEGETRKLPETFFVIATQNPTDQIGTFSLPESQLDRFLMRLSLGYPDHSAERELLMGDDRREMLEDIDAILNPIQLQTIQSHVKQIHCSSALLNYLQDLIQYSRTMNSNLKLLSPRAGLSLLHCAKAWALLHGEKQVIPEYLQTVLPHVVNHRLTSIDNPSQRSLAKTIIENVPIP